MSLTSGSGCPIFLGQTVFPGCGTSNPPSGLCGHPLLVLIVYLLTQKYFVQGIASSGLKA